MGRRTFIAALGGAATQRAVITMQASVTSA